MSEQASLEMILPTDALVEIKAALDKDASAVRAWVCPDCGKLRVEIHEDDWYTMLEPDMPDCNGEMVQVSIETLKEALKRKIN